MSVTHRECVAQNLKRFYDLRVQGIGDGSECDYIQDSSSVGFLFVYFRNNTLLPVRYLQLLNSNKW